MAIRLGTSGPVVPAEVVEPGAPGAGAAGEPSSADSAADRQWRTFLAARRFPELDGLRALSILMVITWHMADPVWSPFNGSLGVTLFFVISGFLITTLLLREEDRDDHVSLRSFYVRRVFRILPMYYLTLVLTTVLVLVLGMGQGSDGFVDRLPLLATFNGEFAGSGTFSLSWSLGIEEKFYIVWPLLAFSAFALGRRRGALLAVLLPAAILASFVPGIGYLGIYAPILGGCALALVMHHRRSFRLAYALANPVVGAVLIAGLVALTFVELPPALQDQSRYGHTVFGLCVVLALPCFLIRTGPQRLLFGAVPAVYYGQHAYAIYLFHPFCLELVDRAIAPGQETPLAAGIRFVLVLVVSFAVAVVLKRYFEDRFIGIGRRMTIPVDRRGAPAPAPTPAHPAGTHRAGA